LTLKIKTNNTKIKKKEKKLLKPMKKEKKYHL